MLHIPLTADQYDALPLYELQAYRVIIRQLTKER